MLADPVPVSADPECQDSASPLTGSGYGELLLCKEESDDDPYVITGQLWASFDVTIEAGVRVEMGAGARIKMDDTVVEDVHIPSVLTIDGTEEDPVVITSGQEEVAKGDWQGIVLYHGASADIDWAEITYGGHSPGETDPCEGEVEVKANTPPSDVTIRNSSLSHSYGSSVRYDGSEITTFPHFELVGNDFLDTGCGLEHISGDIIGNDIQVQAGGAPHTAMFLVRYGDDPIHFYANRVRNGYIRTYTGDDFPKGTVRFNSILGGWIQDDDRTPVLNLRHNWWGRFTAERRPTCESEEPPAVIIDPINGCDAGDNRPHWFADIVPMLPFDPWASPVFLDVYIQMGLTRAGIHHGDPVDVATGSFVDTRADLSAPPVASGLAWSRTYNSKDDNRRDQPLLLGPGWTTPFDASLTVLAGGDVEYRRGDGNQSVFEDDGEGGYLRPPEITGDLTLNEDDTWALDQPDGTRLDFDSDGRVVAITDGAGQVTVIDRGVNDQPETVTSVGYTLTFAYDDEGFPGQVTAVTGTKTGSLDSRTVTYTYEADSTLASVTAGDRTDTYVTGEDEAPDDLLITEVQVATGAETERTQVVNHYEAGSYGRIDYQLMALDDSAEPVELSGGDPRCGGSIPEGFNCVDYSYAYSGVVEVTDLASGDLTTYTFNEDGQILSVEDAAGGFVQRDYDDDGNVSALEDRRENTTVTEYDDFGRPTRRTTADGGVTDYGYEDETVDARLVTVTRYEDFGGEDEEAFTTTYGYPPDDPETETVDESDTRIPRTVTTNDDGDPTTTFDQEAGRVTRITDPDGVVTEYHYDETTTELDTVTVDPDGPDPVVTTFSYDVAGNQHVTTVDPEGLDLETTTTYDPYTGQVTEQTDPGETPTGYEYNPDGTLKTVTDPTGAVTEYTYDPDTGHQTHLTQIERIVDGATAPEPVEYTTTSTYDSSGDLLSETRPGDLTSTGDPLSPSSVTAYSLGALARVRYQLVDDGAHHLDRLTGYAYDADGNRNGVVVDPDNPEVEGPELSLTTTTGYDEMGRATHVANPDDPGGDAPHHTDTTYNDRGLAASSTDESGRVTSYEYDGSGRVLTTTVEVPGLDPVTVETRRYTPAGRLSEVEDGEGDITRYGYDSLGRQTTVTVDPDNPEAAGDELDLTTTTAYDAAGRPTSVQAPSGRTETFDYTIVDGLRVETQHHPTGVATVRTYDQRDQLVSQQEGVGGAYVAETSYLYDDRGNLAAVTDPNDNTVTYTWDGRGNRLTRTSTPDTTPVTETWAYNAADEIIAHTDGLDRTTTYTYDNAGRLHSVSDPSGRTRTYTYRADGPIASITYTHGEDTAEADYLYDETGRRTSADLDGSDGPTTYLYDDPSGQVTSIDGPGTDDDITIGYDNAGRRTSLTYPDETVVDYGYDPAGRLAWIDDDRIDGTVEGSDHSVTYRYDPDGNLLEQNLPDGQYRKWGRDLTTGHVDLFDEQIAEVRRTSGMLWLNDRPWMEWADGTLTVYGYDPAGQLTTVKHTDSPFDTATTGDDITYTYDNVGNRTQRIQGQPGAPDGSVETYTYDNANQLVSRTSTTKDDWVYTYDDAGRLTDSGIDGPDPGTTIDEDADRLTIDYDPRGLPNTVTTTTNGDTTTETRNYDATDTLTATTTDNGGDTTDTSYLWDTALNIPQLLQATNGTDTTTYTNGTTLGPTGGTDRIAATLPDTTTVLFAVDHHGSTIPTTDTTDLVRSTAYDEWGQPTGPPQGNPATQLFGYRSELQTNTLVHLRARAYQPAVGIFTTPDPLDGVDGTPTVANAYPYAGNNPIGEVDPTGMRPNDDEFGSSSSAFGQFIVRLYEIEAVSSSNDDFVRTAAQDIGGFTAGRFGAVPPNRPGGASRGVPGNEIFGASGWRRDLIDDDDGPDADGLPSPARHFIGWFGEGYFHPHVADDNLEIAEAAGPGQSMQDRRSGDIAIDLGIQLRRGNNSRLETILLIEIRAGDPSNTSNGSRPNEPTGGDPLACLLPFAPC